MAISIVQHRSTHTNTTTTGSLAFASNNTAGNLLLYACVEETTNNLNAPTDNNGNTIASAINNQSIGNAAIRLAYVVSCNAGANTVTFTSTSACNLHIHIWEISGCDASAPLDQTRTGTSASTTTPSLATSGSTAVANELVFGMFYDRPNDDSITAGSGFSPSEFQDGGAGNESSLTEVQIVSSTGVQTVTATFGVAQVAVMLVATFKQATATTTVFEDDSLALSSVAQPWLVEPVISVW